MTTTTPVVDPAAASLVPVAESPVSGVSWPAIIAGAFAAAGATMILLSLGSGLGLAAASPYARGPGPATFGVMTGIWLILTQWVSAGAGGYITGRLRTRWANTHTHEVFFRDTAHGFLTWSLATVAAAVLIAPAFAAVAGDAANAANAAGAATVTAADADAARKAASAVSIFTALSMVIGAFIASVAAAIGGHERDMHP